MNHHQLTYLAEQHANLTQTLDTAFNDLLTQVAREILTQWPQFVKRYCAAMGQATFDITCEFSYASNDIEPNYETTIGTSTHNFAKELGNLRIFSNIPLELCVKLREFDALCLHYHEALGPCYSAMMLTQQDGKITEKTDW